MWVLECGMQHIGHIAKFLISILSSRRKNRFWNPHIKQLIYCIVFVREELTEQNRVIVKITGPAVKAPDAEWDLRGLAQPLFPVDTLGVSRFGIAITVHMPDPGPVGGVPVGGGFNVRDLAH